MPSQVSQIIAAGFEYMLVSLLDTNGYPQGISTLAAGSGTGLYRLRGVKTANLNIPSSERVPISGDNRPQGAFLFPPGETPSFDVEASIADFTVAAAFERQIVRDDIGTMMIHPIMSDTTEYLDAMVWLLSHATSKESGSDGLSCVYGLLMPRVKIAYLGPGSFGEREGRAFRFSVAVNNSDKYPWGENVYRSADGDLAVRSAPIFETTNAFWPMLHILHGNAVVDTMTLDYVPVGAHGTDYVTVWDNGTLKVPTTDYTVSLTPPATIDFESGDIPASGHMAVALYEHR